MPTNLPQLYLDCPPVVTSFHAGLILKVPVPPLLNSHSYHGHWCQACLLQHGLYSLGHFTDVGQRKLIEELWAKMPCVGLKELQCLQLGGGEDKYLTLKKEIFQAPHTESNSIFPK